MPTINYETIAPNIGTVTINGGTVNVSWKDPLTGAPMGESSATMSYDSSLGGQMQSSVKRSVVNEIFYAAIRFVTSLLGSGAAGRVVSNAAYTASSELQSRALQNTGYTKATEREAVTRAFESVRDSFVWDEGKQRFVTKAM